MKQIEHKNTLNSFFILCLGTIVLYFFLPKKLTGFDDSIYLDLAKNLFNTHKTHLSTEPIVNISNNIFSFRVVWLFCVWICIQVFGVNIIAVSFPSLVFTLATAFLINKLTQPNKFNATFLFLFCPVIFEFAFSGTPDSALMFFFTLAYYAVAKQQVNKHKIVSAILLSIALFLGFLVKELIVFILPLLVFLAISDLTRKRNIKFWGYSALFTLLLFGSYFLYYKLTAGSFFYRFQVFSDNQYSSFCSYDLLPTVETIKRITLGLPFLIISSLSILLFFPFVLIVKNQKIPQQLIHFIILLLTINFASIKFSSYSPMCLEMRHYLFIFPIAAILIGQITDFGVYKLRLIAIYGIGLILFVIVLYLKYQFKKDYDVRFIEILFYLIPTLGLLFLKNKKALQLSLLITFFVFSIYKNLKKNHVGFFTDAVSSSSLSR